MRDWSGAFPLSVLLSMREDNKTENEKFLFINNQLVISLLSICYEYVQALSSSVLPVGVAAVASHLYQPRACLLRGA